MEHNENREGNGQEAKFIDRFDDVVLGLFAFAERGLLLLIGALAIVAVGFELSDFCLLYTSPSPRDRTRSRMPSSA